MEPIEAVLAPVLKDVSATTDVRLSVGPGDDDPTGPVAFVGDAGIFLSGSAAFADQVVAVASQVQDVVAEELWARASNWPMCPAHPSSHPMEPAVRDGGAWWTCPMDGTVAITIGTLRL